VNAFLYLTIAGGRNRIRTAVGRVKRPRYAIALLVGAFYIWAFLLRPVGGAAPTAFFLSQPTEMIATVLVVVTLMGSWLFGSDTTALAFTPAEVSLLFPAPLTRRALIGYKLFRAQIAVLINALIWVFVLRRGGSDLHPLLRALGLWMLFSTLNLHRLGAALVRSSWREHGRSGLRRQRWSVVAFGVVGVGIAVSLWQHRQGLRIGAGPGAFFSSLGTALATPPASWVLSPFHLIVAPTFAHTLREWLVAIGPAVGMLALHGWWVLRTDVAFEDAAIEASAERARRLDAARSRRSIGASAPTKRPTSTIALSSKGHPALAIVWKNILCLRRTAQLRLFIGPVLMAVVLAGAMAGDDDIAALVATSALVLSGLLLIFGGRLIRNDLRQDMQHLALLKALPIAPSHLMLAEIASSAIPMAAIQVALLVIAFVAAATTEYALVDPVIRVGGILAAPVVALALNAALMTIQNGTAVLFPAWVRLGPAVSSGVEALGQNVLATVSNLVSLSLAVLLPAIAGIGVVRAFGGFTVLSLALGLVVAALLLAFETYAVLRVLGRAFAKAEPLS
jgi:ABC-2 type transport system permease protein